MNIELRLFIIGMFLVITTMTVATQFAFLDYTYEESDIEVIIPTIPDYGIKYIGSDKAIDGKRILRINQNDSNYYKINLGNFTINYQCTYTAAFGIVNEDNTSNHITHIEISPSTSNYMRIWLHGDRDRVADNTFNDPTGVLLYDNGTTISNSNTIAWTLAPGDGNASTICSNITDRSNFTSVLQYDDISGVKYSYDNTNATSAYSDYVWLQIELNIPNEANIQELITGYFYIHLKSD